MLVKNTVKRIKNKYGESVYRKFINWLKINKGKNQNWEDMINLTATILVGKKLAKNKDVFDMMRLILMRDVLKINKKIANII